MQLLIDIKDLSKYKSRDKIPLKCKICEKTFLAPKHKIQAYLKNNPRNQLLVCSLKCRHQNRKTSKQYHCKTCNKEITRRGCDIADSGKIFCSRSCYSKSLIIFKEPKPPRKRGITLSKIQCLYCGNQFKKTPSSMAASKTRRFFCSHSCKMKYLNKNVIIHKSKSKAESYLSSLLFQKYPLLIIQQNIRTILPSGLEIDIFIPELKIAIELNGPFHYFPIFGDETLKNSQDRDIKKQIEINQLGLDSMVINISSLNGQKKTKKFLDDYFELKIKPIIDYKISCSIPNCTGKTP